MKHGVCGMTPLNTATAEEHVQLLQAAGAGSHSGVEYVEDGEPGNFMEAEPSNPRLESAPRGEPEVSQEAADNAQPAQAAYGGPKTPPPQDPQIEYPIDIQ